MNRQANPPATPAPTSAWAIYRAIVGIGLLCAVLIVSVYRGTAGPIQANEQAALERAIALVLPTAVEVVEVVVDDSGDLALASEGKRRLPAFLGYDAAGELVGAAITAQGMGYQDNIRVIYAYSFSELAIVAFEVLDSKETPGLGDKIETDERFRQNFVGLDAALADDGTHLRNAIVTVAHGTKTSAWQIDAVSGATISSDTIGNILDQSASRWVPALERGARTLPPDAGEPETM